MKSSQHQCSLKLAATDVTDGHLKFDFKINRHFFKCINVNFLHTKFYFYNFVGWHRELHIRNFLTNSSIKKTNISIKKTNSSIKKTNSSIKKTNSSIKKTNSSIKKTNSSIKNTNSSIKKTNSSIKKMCQRQFRSIGT